MAEFITAGQVNVTATSARSTADGPTHVTNAGRPTSLDVTGNVSNAGKLAAVAQWKQIAVKVWIDDGSGTLVLVPNSEITNDLSIVESLDGWADELSFGLVGNRWSPWLSAAIRGKYGVRVDVSYGQPGSLFFATIFDGFIQAGSFTVYPPVARVRVMDTAVKYSTRVVNYNLPGKSGKTRLAILTELLKLDPANPVPVASIDLGPDGGGVVTKSLSTGPDAKLFDLIRDAICVPCGAHMYFAGGGLVIARYASRPSIIRTLTRRDISRGQLDLQVPDTSAANVVTVVTVDFRPNAAPTLRTGEPVIEETFSVYQPEAVFYQDSAGVVTSLSTFESASMRLTGRVRTTSTYLGSVLVFQQVDEYGWFSPIAARSNVAVQSDRPENEVVVGPVASGAFQFADGTWHKERVERFRLVRRTIARKTLNADQFVTASREDRYFWQSLGTSPYGVVANTVSPFLPPTLAHTFGIDIDERGEGMQQGQQLMAGNTVALDEQATVVSTLPDSSMTTTWDLDADGTIRRETVTEEAWGPARPVRPGAIGSYRRGLASTVYALDPYDVYNGNHVRTTKTYTQTDEEAYGVVEVMDDGTGNPVRKNSTGTGSRPRAEQVQPETSSVEVRATIQDGTRVALSGRTALTIHNEYCETQEEARLVAATELRRLSSWTVTLQMPLEGQIHKGSTIKLSGLEEIGGDGRLLDVVGIQRDFGHYIQTLTAVYRPPEVADL